MQAAVFPLSTNVLIVTVSPVFPGGRFTDDSGYNIAVASYQAVLANQGLSSLYVDLGSLNYTEITGAANPSNTLDWTQIKTAINNLEKATGTQYLVVLGDATIVPMPSIPAIAPGVVEDLRDFLKTAPVIPTDDTYGNVIADGTIPSVAIGRMPGGNADEIANILQDAVSYRQNGNGNTAAFTDITTSPYQNAFGNSDVLRFTNEFLALANLPLCLDRPSSQNPCYQSPPYCAVSGNLRSLAPCPKTADLNGAMKTYGIQYYDCHGTGWDCDGGNNYIILYYPQVYLPQDPVIIMDSCYGGEIPGTTTYKALQAFYLNEGIHTNSE